jgi:transcriptional regulator with XRE-family HTH domain
MSTTATRRADVSNSEVGKALGLTHSMASRLRSGVRIPSVQTIAAIERVYRWKAGVQVQSVVKGNFARDFEEMLIKRHGEGGHGE